MNLRTSPRARLALLAFALISLALLFALTSRIGGPSLGGPASTLHARFADAGGVSERADVLVRGVRVGRVGSVRTSGGTTTLTLELTRADLPLHAGAFARIGQKTPLGEPFVDLVLGSGRGPGPGDGGWLRTRPNVEIDEALDLLDEGGRAHLNGLTATLARGAAAPDAPRRIGAATEQTRTAVEAFDDLAATLHGQERQLAGAIDGSRRLLDVVGAHAGSVREIVTAGRATLAATSAQREALGATLDRLPRVLATARRTLAHARPLIAEAQPAAEQLRAAAPALTAALRELPSVSRSARSVIDRGPELERAAGPALDAARDLLPVAAPAVKRLAPALANAVPMARYLEPRHRTIAAWFSNTADLGSNGDAKGRWARFFVMFDPATATGSPAGAPPGNSYTQPDDALDNQPYRPGDYPRLMPYAPALGR